MQWIEYTIKTVLSQVEKVEGILYELGFTSYEIRDDVPLSREDEKRMFTDISAELPKTDRAEFIVYSTEDDVSGLSTGSSIRDEALTDTFLRKGAEETMKLIGEALSKAYEGNESEKPSVTYSIRDDSEWKDKYKEAFKSFRVTSDIIIKPMWEERPDFANEEDIIVTINPGAGFGTGMHDTTKLCLTALEKHLKPGMDVLDIGCGSGILGITALCLGARSAVLMDIDELAIDNVKEDMELNSITEDKYSAFRADILTDTKAVKEKVGHKSDIVLANILDDVIVPLTSVVSEFMNPGGLFITSGILLERAERVKKALLEAGFEIVDYSESGEWSSFTARLAGES